jgi:hypothetical protein
VVLVERLAADDRPLDAAGRLDVDRDVDRDEPARAGARLAPAVDFDEAREEDAFVDLVLEAGVVCFVATGVRDSLVAPSARHRRWYRPDGTDAGIGLGNHPDGGSGTAVRRGTSVQRTQKGFA